MKHNIRQFSFGMVLGLLTMYSYHSYANWEILRKQRNFGKSIREESALLTTTYSNAFTTSAYNRLQAKDLPDFMHMMEIQQSERQVTLRKACQRIKQDCQPFGFQARNLNLFCNEYKFTVCEINKCGSTSWLQAIMVMDGFYTVDDYRNHVIRGREVIQASNQKARLTAIANQTEIQRLWKDYLNIITVRNPLHRIVSAYNDKMRPESGGFTHVYGALSKRINKQFKMYRHRKEERSIADDDTASFEDFVNFLIYSREPAAYDPHWKPFHKHCSPCIFEYDFIMKFETMFEDVAYLKGKLNVSDEHAKAFFPKWTTRFNNDDTTEKYFEKLPSRLLQALYDKYKVDFELFGYQQPSWLC